MLVAHRLSGPKLSPACRRAACFALIFVTIAVLLGACDNEPVPTATTQLANTPTALATSAPTPSCAPTRTPTRAAAPKPSPTPSHTPTPTPAATAITSQKPTAEPQPTSIAIQYPTTTPTPTPTAEEIAASRLSEIIPWFENPQAGSHGFVAELLIDLWLSNGDLGNKVAGFPWVTDGVTDGERNFVAALGRIARADLELAKTVANLHWLSDDVNDKERVTIQILDRIASEDIEFARRAVGFQWFAAEAPVDNMMALSRLRKIGANNVDLAMLGVRSSWFEDGLTSDELISLGALWRMADNDHLELARNLAGSPLLAANQHRDLQVHALAFLGEMAASDPHALDQLTALPWFADGLDEEDMTLVVTLGNL